MTNLIRQFYLEGIKTASLGLGLDANAFVQFAHEDTTEQSHGEATMKTPNAEKAVHWSGRSGLEGGDAGTRNEQMGLPRNGAV